MKTARCLSRMIWLMLAAPLLAGADDTSMPSGQKALENYQDIIVTLNEVDGPDDYDFAVQHLTSIIQFYPDWPEPYYTLGILLEKQGRYDEAAEALRTYLALKPNAHPATDAAKNSGRSSRSPALHTHAKRHTPIRHHPGRIHSGSRHSSVGSPVAGGMATVSSRLTATPHNTPGSNTADM